MKGPVYNARQLRAKHSNVISPATSVKHLNLKGVNVFSIDRGQDNFLCRIDAFQPATFHPRMTIFGFNTDVKHGDVTYHVQTEARPRDLLLQTLVFVKGQCVSKHATSYAHKTVEPGFTEQGVHELLKAQHRNALEAIQLGQLSQLTGPGHIQDVGGGGLSLNWTIVESTGRIVLAANVLDGAVHANGAELILVAADAHSKLGTAHTDKEGNAEIVLMVDEGLKSAQSVLLRAEFEGKSVTRKVRLPVTPS
jgi:hypothetical protein